ncbi:MAG: hypothetical protein AAF674_19195 [Pseudomonadota bacterium]
MTTWSLTHDAGRTHLVARGIPDRWDIWAAAVWTADLPADPLSPQVRARLAHQIRQDIWRAAQRVRGFVPRVTLEQTDGHLTIRAGGTITTDTPCPAGLTDALAAILQNDKNRRRWMTHATRAKGGRRCSTRS